MYYPPQPTYWHWRMAALAIALTLGVAGSFALGQAMGHHATSSVAAHHPTTVTRSAGMATGALSTASAPTPTPQPALPSAAPAQPLSATSPSAQPQHDKHADGDQGDGHHHEGDHHGGGGGDHHGGGGD